MKYTMLLVILTILSVTVAAEGKKDCHVTNGKADWEVVKGTGYSLGTSRENVFGTVTRITTLKQCQHECLRLKDACVAIDVFDDKKSLVCYTADEIESNADNMVESQHHTIYKLESNCSGDCYRTNGKADWDPEVVKDREYDVGTPRLTVPGTETRITTLQQCKHECEKLDDCAAINVRDVKDHLRCYTLTESDVKSKEWNESPNWIVYKLKSKCNGDCGTNGKADWEVIKDKDCIAGTRQEEVSNTEQCQDVCVKDCVGVTFCEMDNGDLYCSTHTESECDNPFDSSYCTLYKLKPKCNDGAKKNE